MRIPFPYALNIGTDIIAYKRLARYFDQTDRNISIGRLVRRILHPKEISDLQKRFPDWQAVRSDDVVKQTKCVTWLAGRWAAKEAAKKAWGAHLISFRDLRIETQPDGDVTVVCQSYQSESSQHPTSTKAEMEQVGKLSISHDGDYAVATVIASPLHLEIVDSLRSRKVVIDKNSKGELAEHKDEIGHAP